MSGVDNWNVVDIHTDSWMSLPSSMISTSENSSIRQLLEEGNQSDDSKLSIVAEKTKNLLNNNLDAIYLTEDSIIVDISESSKSPRDTNLAMLDVERAIDEKKDALFSKKMSKNEKSSKKQLQKRTSMDASKQYKYYLGLDNLKQNQIFKNKYVNNLGMDSRVNALLKSPVVSGPRVAQIKEFFESICRSSSSSLNPEQRRIESRLSLPAYKNNYLRAHEGLGSGGRANTINSSICAGPRAIAGPLPWGSSRAVVGAQRGSDKATPKKTPASKDKNNNGGGSCSNTTPIICRRFILKTNSPASCGVSRSPIRPVYQIRKIFSPKASPRAAAASQHKKKGFKSLLPPPPPPPPPPSRSSNRLLMLAC